MVKTEVDLSPLHVLQRAQHRPHRSRRWINFVEETNASQLHERKVKTVLLKPCDSDLDLNPWSFSWDHTPWFQDLMKRSMSHHRENFGRDKVIGRKWIYLESNTLRRQSGSHLRRERPWNLVWLVFMGWVISQANVCNSLVIHFVSSRKPLPLSEAGSSAPQHQRIACSLMLITLH